MSKKEEKTDAQQTTPEQAAEQTQAAEPETAAAKPPEPEKPAQKAYTFLEVRRAFSAKAHEGRTEEVRALIAKYGAEKLSAVKEEDYAAIMADLEALS